MHRLYQFGQVNLAIPVTDFTHLMETGKGNTPFRSTISGESASGLWTETRMTLRYVTITETVKSYEYS